MSARDGSALTFLLLLAGLLLWPAAGYSGELRLSWLDRSIDAQGFSVERSDPATGAFAVIATTPPGVTSYTDATVADSTTYCYRVQAFNAVAYSDYSYQACATSAPATVTVALDISQPAFALGDRFQLDVALNSAGSAAVADVYVGGFLPPSGDGAVDCPGRDPIAYIVDAPAALDGLVTTCGSGEGSTMVPVFQGVSVANELPALMGAGFFSFDWPLTTPGEYTVFVTLTEAGSLNVIAQGTATISYTP